MALWIVAVVALAGHGAAREGNASRREAPMNEERAQEANSGDLTDEQGQVALGDHRDADAAYRGVIRKGER